MEKRILVVEDNPDNMYVLDHILTHSGYEVEQAVTGEEALGAMTARPFDLVLMDMQIPGLDGYAAVRALRQMPSLAGVPVIAVTANSMPGDRQRSLEAGCTEYVSKPIDTRGLLQLIDHYLGGSGSGENSDR